MADDFDLFFDDDSTSDLPELPEGAVPRLPRPKFTDEFQRHTVDTGALRPLDEEDFKTVTIEPYVPPHAITPRTPSRPVASQRRSRRTAKPYKSRPWLSMIGSLVATVSAAVLVATIFSLWTRPDFFPDEFRAGLNRVQATQHLINIQPTPIPTNVQEVKIGIIAGHSGKPQDPSFAMDPGAVCDDGLTELEINTTVAQAVVAALRRDQYTVELLEEFDPKLENYQADLLISIHANDCQDYGEAGTGYAVASAAARATTPGADERLLNCLVEQYGKTTGLPHHSGITRDMTEYHTFGEVSLDTPVAIIELGFLRNDRAILTGRPDLLAQGITNGIHCFLRPEIYNTPTPPPTEQVAG